MRILGRAATAAAALSLAATPAIAAQNSASALSLRAATKAENASDIQSPPVIAMIGLAAIIAGAVIIVAQDDDHPDSP